jgi:hypothetical protein
MTSISKSLDFTASSTTPITTTNTTTVHHQPVIKNMFGEKLDFDAYRKVIQARSEHLRPKLKYIDYTNVWNIKPVDFTTSLYHPRPPKRNSREAIKPWEYAKLMKSTSTDDLRLGPQKKNAEELMVQSFMEQQAISNRGEGEEDDEPEEFERMFRVLTPNEDRFETAAKRNAYRAHLDEYQMWKPHDFRGVGYFNN